MESNSMTLETARRLCLSLEDAREDQPFGPETLVFKINNKIFAILPFDSHPASINCKCNPGRALQLREQYSGITPGYHMNKKHWNTVKVSPRLSWTLICEMIEHSYGLVCKKDKKSKGNISAS